MSSELFSPSLSPHFDTPSTRSMRIGLFDSGYGGLTILSKIRQRLPQYSYIYLGDNARAPYGTRSFDCIYAYTLEAVRFLQEQGCSLIILACNTASAKALRTIQQRNIDPSKVRVLGVIRPTVEVVPALTRSGHVGILATTGTVASESYVIELRKQEQLLNASTQSAPHPIQSPIHALSPSVSPCTRPPLHITQQACPLWVPLIEAGEHLSTGADYFIHKYVAQILHADPLIDTLVLGCTHYPLIQQRIDAVIRELSNDLHSQRHLHTPAANQSNDFSADLPHTCQTIAQGDIVSRSLEHYLLRHPEIEQSLIHGADCTYLTTDDASRFNAAAHLFLGQPIAAQHVSYS